MYVFSCKMATLGDLSVETEVLSSYTSSTSTATSCEGSPPVISLLDQLSAPKPPEMCWKRAVDRNPLSKGKKTSSRNKCVIQSR